MLFSRENQLISFVPRYRLVVRAGVSDLGRTFSEPPLCDQIKEIGKKMKFCGAINIQGKIFKNEISFFEINPRFSGGIQLTIAAGENFADFIVRELGGEHLKPRLEQYRSQLTMTSYEDSIFLDARRNVTFFYSQHQDILPSKNKFTL